MTVSLLFLALVSLSGPAVAPQQDISSRQAAQGVASCGIGPVVPRHDADLLQDVLVASGAAAASEEQLACAIAAAGDYLLVLPAGVQQRYETLREARQTASSLAQARAWLGQRGLLERIPEYQPGTTSPALFASQVESLCGPMASGAFRRGENDQASARAWLDGVLQSAHSDQDALACVLNIIRAAGAEAAFVGNEDRPPE